MDKDKVLPMHDELCGDIPSPSDSERRLKGIVFSLQRRQEKAKCKISKGRQTMINIVAKSMIGE